jgi:hypothetical protein
MSWLLDSGLFAVPNNFFAISFHHEYWLSLINFTVSRNADFDVGGKMTDIFVMYRNHGLLALAGKGFVKVKIKFAFFSHDEENTQIVRHEKRKAERTMPMRFLVAPTRFKRVPWPSRFTFRKKEVDVFETYASCRAHQLFSKQCP